MQYKKGFTLVELLAVIVILSMILTISIPIIITAIDNIRRDSFASAAKMMIASAKLKISEDKNIKLPPNNYDATIIKLSYLKLDNLSKDIDGGFYSKNNSYLLIVKLNNEIFYYVTLQGSKRKINLVKEGTIDGNKVTSDTSVTLPKAVNGTYSSIELGEVIPYSVTVRYSY